MGELSRRTFLGGLVASGAAAGTAPKEISTELAELGTKPKSAHVAAKEIDFRHAPRLSQATICFPDDPEKSLVGQAGDLRYGFANPPTTGMEDFATVCTFSLAGMQDDRVLRQWLEAPHIPIVHTLIERPTATLELMAFATRHANEGRVDNVLMTILPKQAPVAAIPRIHFRTCLPLKQSSGPPTIVINEAFQKYDAELMGISVDGVWCHAAFSKDRHLHFPLLADFEPKGHVAKKYGAYRDQDGVCERALFVIDKEGKIFWSYCSPIAVNPGAEGILQALEGLQSA